MRRDVDDEPALFSREIELQFVDAYDKLLRATDGLDLSRDLVAGARDCRQAQVANTQDEVTKRLTVIASVLLLPAFIVGLYGTDSKAVREYDWANGYLWAWALIVASTIAAVAWFRWKIWL